MWVCAFLYFWFQTAVQSNTDSEVLWHAWGVSEKRDGNFGVARKPGEKSDGDKIRSLPFI